MARVLVRGSGDMGSAVAYALFAAGHSVVIHDDATPPHTRRRMSFVDALFDGISVLEGMLGKRIPGLDSLMPMVRCRQAVPLSCDPWLETIATLMPEVLVDARMRKHDRGEDQIHLARLTVGLGPGFTARGNVHVAVETEWGERMGALVRDGSTSPLRGEPRPFGGVARERFVYAPQPGLFRACADIGMPVTAGEILGEIGAVPIRAPLAGHVRGICHSGAHVSTGTKVLEIDPRDGVVSWVGIGDRPRQVARGVLGALEAAA